MHGAVPLLQDYLHHSARRSGDKTALICRDRRVSYSELMRWSNSLANTLRARGVNRGDRVLIFADNTVETVVAFWAALKADAIVCIVNPLTKSDKLLYLVDDCRPAALITDAHLHSSWREAALSPHLETMIVSGRTRESTFDDTAKSLTWDDALRADESTSPAFCNIDIDLAAIVYTSGSTGEPKGVMLSHRNMLTAATSIASYLRLGQDDVILNALPLAFDYGLYQMIMAFRQGASLVLERSFTFPAQVLKTIAAERVTCFPGVPTIFAMLGEMGMLEEYDFSSVRLVTNTAAALPAKHIGLLRSVFPRAQIYSMYGLTECKRCTYLPPRDLERKPTSVGIAIPNTELWIVDENGARLGPGQVGQLVIRGSTVMQGYWEKPEATAHKLKPGPLPGERVLYTGDYCKLDEEGYLYFVGRMDDIIKSRGEKVSPKEVEAVISELPAVKEAAVIGVPDELLGEAIKAFVVLQQGASTTEREVQLACREKLESFMVPKSVVFVRELPKTDTGKIKKTGLAAVRS
jgi:amino acid adenylation domain-containing protein